MLFSPGAFHRLKGPAAERNKLVDNPRLPFRRRRLHKQNVPISLSISHERRRVVVVVEGEGSLVEGLKALTRIFAAGALPYAKLIDFSFAKPEEGAAAIRKISQFVGRFAKGKKPGPLAFVARSELVKDMILLFEHQMRPEIRAERPMRIFPDEASAAAWLDELETAAKPQSG
jgi:hypothetical protein